MTAADRAPDTAQPADQQTDSAGTEPNSCPIAGILYLSQPEAPRGQRAPSDRFFRSLADDQGENAVYIFPCNEVPS